MSSLRVLHFADLHIGMENYGRLDPQTGISSRIGDFLARLDEVAAYARDQEADLVVFAGDAFKTRDPDPTQQREFARRIKALAEQVPVLLLVGNHDVPGIAARATSIDIFSTLEVANVIVGRTPGARVVDTRRGPVYLAWMPFPVRSRLLARDEHRAASIEDLDRALEGIVIDTLGQFAREAAAHAMPRLLAGHFSVGGATFGSERSVMVGRDLVVPKSALADPAWDYVALGHIHKHQNLTAGEAGTVPPVVYAGSLERIDFGEENDPKGFCWVELERKHTAWKFHRLKARPFVTIRADLRKSADPTRDTVDEVEAYDLQGAVVRMILDLTPETEARLNEGIVRDALHRGGVAYIAGIRREIEQTARARLGASPEGLTDDQLLERYLISKGMDETRRAVLLAAGQEMMGEGAAGGAAEA